MLEREPEATGVERFLGIDIGSVNIKVALVDRAGNVLHLDSERISKGPAAAVAALLDRLAVHQALDDIVSAGVAGSGRHLFDDDSGWQIFSSPYAAIAGLVYDCPDAKTIVAIGGQSALVIGLADGLNQPWRVTRSPLCAAGTGRFLEQQASRLGIAIEEFGPKAVEWRKPPPRIAARCSVFAKSDLIHLQQKGWSVSAMLSGLSDSVARMIVAQWRDDFVSPVYCVGGVAANQGVIRALSAVLDDAPVLVPSSPAGREAIGAALLSRAQRRRPASFYLSEGRDAEVFFISRQLPAVHCSNGWQPATLDAASIEVYLGVDVGSTSTKAAVIRSDGSVVAKTYLMTSGQPLEAVKQVMANLAPMVEGKVVVRGVGVTGSGRYLVGNFVGADLIKNEITAQTKAALHIDPQVNTVFELGGQDSKFVYLENGTVLDYQMNKACAAGTGSFIDELADQLGVSTRTGDFAQLAFEASLQLDLGEKCAAFMSQAVTSAQYAGASLGSIVASLSVSLAKNYRSKVVGTRRVGDHIFLTGAVFYNQAAVSAFRAEFPGKTLVVPEHKEVTGAIGAALLAQEVMATNDTSQFKGFSTIAGLGYDLKNFTCYQCENNCAISMMTTEGGVRLFYGSRCDHFDAAGNGRGPRKVATPFTEREGLLFAGYDPSTGNGAVVGIPRALMSFDLAPLLTSFVSGLGLKVRYSTPTNKHVIEKALARAYSDSCFPIKLLHGHTADLLEAGVDYVLIPNAIRMSEKGGDEDQRYSCPLVQAAPYLVNSTFNLGDRLLDPVIDLSKGDDKTVESFAGLAGRMGFSRRQGRQAARQALTEQRQFEQAAVKAGQRVLDELAANRDQLGVVLLSRAYNAQDSGANLGMADELRKLGVVPIPLDYLPLHQIDVGKITDRPYWNYERKLIAAAKIIADHPQLFGLFLSNFGCGPNSFIQNVVEDIMGGKPLGQIEVDEHAAEAGYITRLEALVDTIRGYYRAGLQLTGNPAKYTRQVPPMQASSKIVFIPPMADHAEGVAAAMRAFGVNAQMLPESDDRSMALSRDVTNGKECLPFRDTLGVFLRMAADGLLPPQARVLMASSFGPCRFGKYAQEQQKILDERGIDLKIMATVSNNAYADLGLGSRFELLAWQSIVTVDHLKRLLWITRPYEREPGAADRSYEHYLSGLSKLVERRQPLRPLLKEAAETFLSLRDPSLPGRPRVGINGEIYLRANRFCNNDLVLLCEANGLEVEISPMSEWIKYTTVRNLEDGWADRDYRRLLKGTIRKLALDRYERNISSAFRPAIAEDEPSIAVLMRASAAYLPGRNGSEAVLSLGSGLRQMADPHFAAVISVMPHGCMPGGIVAAMAEQISRQFGHKPWISLTYDGFADKVNPERIADLGEQLRHQAGRNGHR